MSGRSKKVLTEWFQTDSVTIDGSDGQKTPSIEVNSVKSSEPKEDGPLGKHLAIAAEHGFYYRNPKLSGDKWFCMGSEGDELMAWKNIAFELMVQYVKRTQGSFIENKGSALVWQYDFYVLSNRNIYEMEINDCVQIM